MTKKGLVLLKNKPLNGFLIHPDYAKPSLHGLTVYGKAGIVVNLSLT